MIDLIFLENCYDGIMKEWLAEISVGPDLPSDRELRSKITGRAIKRAKVRLGALSEIKGIPKEDLAIRSFENLPFISLRASAKFAERIRDVPGIVGLLEVTQQEENY